MKWEDFRASQRVYEEAFGAYNTYVLANQALIGINSDSSSEDVSMDFDILTVRDEEDGADDCLFSKPVFVKNFSIFGKKSVIRLIQFIAMESHEIFEAKMKTLREMGVEVPSDPFPELRE